MDIEENHIKLINQQKDDLRFNPFGGLTDSESNALMVPSENQTQLIKNILEKNFNTVALIGKRGRGKSTILKLLYELNNDGQLLRIQKDKKYHIEPNNTPLFVDGIYHLNISERAKIWKLGRPIVYVAHRNVFQLEIYLKRRKQLKYLIKGLSLSQLKEIVNKRMVWGGIHNNPKYESIRSLETLLH